MKIHFLVMAAWASALNAQVAVEEQAVESELRISCEPMEEPTGTMWYQKRVTYELPGYLPLIIEEDMEKGVFPTGASVVHKLGPARFLLMGGYSAGGGRYTKVAMIIQGEDGHLTVKDQLEFSRDRGKFEDRVFRLGDSFAVGFPSLPLEGHHELFDWNIEHRGERFYTDEMRGWPLEKIEGAEIEVIVVRIGKDGFLLPTSPKAEQVSGGNGGQTR